MGLRFTTFFASIASFLLFCWPAMGQQKLTPRYGGTLQISAHRDIAALNPFFGTRSWVRRIMTLSYEPLFTFDEKYAIEPNLATSWKVSPDGLVYTIELRQGVTFHNGQEMTAEDVKWCFDFVLDPKNAATGLSDLRLVDNVEVIGPYAVRVRLKSPSAVFLSSLSEIQTLLVVPKGSIAGGRLKPDKAPPGTGPFQLVSWQPDRRIVFRKFDRYWKKGLPYVDEIIYHRITEDVTRFAALRVGEIDITNLTNQADVINIRSGKIQGIKLAESIYSNFRRVAFNVREGPFKDRRLRQAVAYAIDKNQLVEGAYLGLGFPASQRIPPGSAYFFKDIPDKTNDIDRARALLRDSGYEKGFQFVAIGRRGTEQELQVIQSQLRRAGIDMVLQMLDTAVYDARQRKGEFVMTLRGGEVSVEPDGAYYDDYYTEPGEIRARNYSGLRHPEVDRLLDEGKKTVSEDRRRKIYHRVVEILNDEVPEIYLAFIVRFYGVRSYVHGFRADQINGNLYHPGGGGWGVPLAWVEK